MNLMMFVIPKSMVEYVTEDSTLRQGIEKMRYHRYAAIPVLDREGVYVGTLRNDDILRYAFESGDVSAKSWESVGVSDVIDEGYVKPIYHTASLEDVMDRVKEHNFVPVVDDRGCFIGIILRRDILNYLIKFYNDNDRGNR